MKANELRIGNWIYDPVNKTEFQIDCFLGTDYCTNKCEFETEEFDAKLEDCQPIPLTEKWLLNFGFELINNEFYRSRNSELCLYWTINKNKMIPEYNEKRFVTGYDFKYVHQLQNLYFALTGEELTIKEL